MGSPTIDSLAAGYRSFALPTAPPVTIPNPTGIRPSGHTTGAPSRRAGGDLWRPSMRTARLLGQAGVARASAHAGCQLAERQGAVAGCQMGATSLRTMPPEVAERAVCDFTT